MGTHDHACYCDHVDMARMEVSFDLFLRDLAGGGWQVVDATETAFHLWAVDKSCRTFLAGVAVVHHGCGLMWLWNIGPLKLRGGEVAESKQKQKKTSKQIVDADQVERSSKSIGLADTETPLSRCPHRYHLPSEMWQERCQARLLLTLES
jgi:hypothetical protein